MTIEFGNEGHFHVQGVAAHLVVVAVCLGKFGGPRTAEELVWPNGPKKPPEKPKKYNFLNIHNLYQE